MRSDPKVRLQDTFPKQSICTILVNHSQSVLGKLNAGLGLHRLYDSPSWNGPKIKGVRQTGSIRPWQWKKEFDKLQILAVQVHKTHIKSGFCWAFKHITSKKHILHAFQIHTDIRIRLADVIAVCRPVSTCSLRRQNWRTNLLESLNGPKREKKHLI